MLTATDFRWPSLATVDLSGATVLGTGTHGKHLLTRLDHDGRRLTLHTHLKMEGVWRLSMPDSRWPRPLTRRAWCSRTDGRDAVGFALGIVELLPTADEDGIIGHLGPDLMADDWDEDEALRRLLADPGPTARRGAARPDRRRRDRDHLPRRDLLPPGCSPARPGQRRP